MANIHGDFIWYELLTPEADVAQKFYGDLMGWQVADSGHSEVDYRVFSAPEENGDKVNGVGGLMQITPEMQDKGARPVWLGYIGVDDVDSAVAAITAAGGQLLIPAMDVTDVGRFAMVTDPEGAPFYIMRGAVDGTSLAFAFDKPRPGHCAWNELATSDPAAALKFYGKQFGWAKEGEMDLGPMGKYEFIRHGGIIGAVMPTWPDQQQPLWTFYFRVPDIDVAVAKITAGGGRITQPPHEIPGGNFSLKGIDPQGARFALVGAREGKNG